jgi:hypothetical protein
VGAGDQIIDSRDSAAELRAAGAGGRRVECCGRISPIWPRLMQERIRANARRTAGAAVAIELEVWWPAELITGGALELLSCAAVPA